MEKKVLGPGSLCLIVNPTAGSGKAMDVLKEVQSLLEKAEVSYTLWETQYPGHGTELAKKAALEGFDTVCALGGDGTVREIALGLLGTACTLAIIPCGTGNDFVRPLEIPKDPAGAVDTLLLGKRLIVDCGRANNILYVNVAGFGFDVDVLDSVELFKGKTKNGRLAYLKGLFHALKSFRLRKVTYSIDGGAETSCDCLLIAASNGTHFGGGLGIAPEADPADGLLDFCIIGNVRNIWDVCVLLPAFLRGTFLKLTKYVTYCRGKVLTARCEPASRIQVDGERLPGTPVTFALAEEKLRVLVPSWRKEKVRA